MELAKPTQEQAAFGSLLTRMNRRKAFIAIARHGGPRQALRATGVGAHDRPPDAILAQCERYGVGMMTYFDHEFPAVLRHIPDPPLVLYVLGSLACLNQACVAVVGARRCSRGGAELARELARGLIGADLTVISGLARGIDAAAHRGGLDGLPGKPSTVGANTVAVMGAGLGSVYPRANTQLARAIVDAGGALISEYLPALPPAKHQFPERNRLISGLSRGVVIVEAGEHSGSLITARFALEQGREVMAVPGAVAPGLSRGCHRLLREGAALVEGCADVLEVLGFMFEAADGPAREALMAPAWVGGVLAAVEPAVTTLDELVAATGLAPEDLASKLLELELGGFVQKVAEGYIRRPFSQS